MASASRARASRGFTLLELVIVVCLVAIFAAVALDRFLRYQEIAEKAAMEATIGAIRSAEALQASARILATGLSSVERMADENPVEWLALPPAGYRGALYDTADAEIPGGSWYYDLKNKELVYRPQRVRYFSAPPESAGRIRYRVVVVIGRAHEQGPARSLSRLDIVPVYRVIWAPEF